MKLTVFLLIVLASFCFSLTIPDDPQESQIFYDNYEKYISGLAKNHSYSNLDALNHALFACAIRAEGYTNPDTRLIRCFTSAQQAIINTPDHGRYYSDKFEKFQNTKTWDDGGYFRHQLVAQTLVHLPSSEIVWLLGKYLDDFSETETPNLPLEEQVITNRIPKTNDYLYSADLPWLATYAISKIGLRDPPVNNTKLPEYAFDPECTSRWKTTRAWYQEVKAGKRTFSFRGQPVEYRFNADGTWETIALKNPPDDAITYPRYSSSEPPGTAALLTASKNTADKDTPWWRWLMATLLVISAAITWRIAAKRSNQSSP